MEFKVKWALGRITMNKASGGDGIPVELFQILKDDAVKVLHSKCFLSQINSSERVTGRKASGLQMEEIGCKCQTFLSLLSGRRKQTSYIFFLLYTNLKGGFS